MNSPQQATEGADERLAIIELADELQIRKQTIFKVVKRMGIQPQDRRESSRGNQKVATVTRLEATAITNELRRKRSSDTDSINAPIDAPADFLGDEIGFFYLIQLEPEHDRGRFKVGFTTELQGRLRKHRCAAPFANYLQSWPCRRAWERAAMDCTTSGCERLHTEVFRASSIDDVISLAERFFALMPRLSPVSPDE